MKILVAPDKFKGSLSAKEVAENIGRGLRDILQNARIGIMPMADGGEGTAEVIRDALGGEWVTTPAHDPLGREIEASYVHVAAKNLAIMEMSEAAGMRRLKQEEYDVQRASTFGVGEMILDATRQGARKIIIGLGGSATNDGGFGMASALGFRFADAKGRLLESVMELGEQSVIDKIPDVSLPRIMAAADVKNPLLGENGATRVFGPQKGATSHEVDLLENALANFANLVTRDLHLDFRNEPGAGAAGGLGFGLMSFCNATLRSGFDVVAETVGLEAKMKEVDIVITGEGSLDRQTLEGKTPAGVARMARRLGKRVFAVVGRATEDRETREIFDGVYELGGSISQAAELLRERAQELGRLLKKTPNAQGPTSNAE